nr:endonuclease/exonuclease/phosphatase family protein [Halovulum dunhuangense]
MLLAAPAAQLAAETLRIATYNASLTRAGPGVLLKDLGRDDPQIDAVAAVIAYVRPDILLLTSMDYDAGGEALAVLADRLALAGVSYPHLFSDAVNAGWPSGLDLDGDGRVFGPGDGWGFGHFPGRAGMALLSVHPVADLHDFRLLPWQDLPNARLPRLADGSPFPSAEAQAAMRLSTTAHWDIALATPGGQLRLLASHVSPPVFDGPERANLLRNADEIRFWHLYLDGTAFPDAAGTARSLEPGPLVVLGDLNADPADGDGDRSVVAALLAHPRLQDPRPRSIGGASAADPSHRGDPSTDTAAWSRPGALRVDYVLPSADLRVTASGVFWPEPGAPLADIAARASAHRLVWVDIEWPPVPLP